MARQRTGSLTWTKSGWAARITTTVDGEKVRKQIQLGTSDKGAARVKLQRLLDSDAPTAAEAQRVETFQEAALRIVARQKAEGLVTHEDRISRLTRFAFPEMGALAVTAIRPAHIRSVLDAVNALGKSRTTVGHLLHDIGGVLADLWRDEVLPENPADRVQIPKSAKLDDRERVVLTDFEFAQFMACPDVGAELHTMAMSSRTMGGMRTSDLHAWDWSHIDVRTWADAFVPRPKTRRKTGSAGARLELPSMLVPVLQAWWHAAGRPVAGPVFPQRKGPNAGKRKGEASYARSLRKALWAAGIVRPLPGFEDATTDDERRALCQIQAGSESTRAVDFHSFRRAFATGLANANVNAQTAMRLAGHRSAATHQRYVDKSRTLATPDAALPQLQTTSLVPFPKAKPKHNRGVNMVNQRPSQPPSTARIWPLT